MFDLSQVTTKAAVFDTDKLDHINQEQMKRMDPYRLLEIIKPFWKKMGLEPEQYGDDYLASAIKTMGGRGRTTLQLAEYSDYFLSFDAVKARYDASDVSEESRPLLRRFYRELVDKTSEWKAPAMEQFTKDWIGANGSSMKELCLPLRWVLTGRKVSPGVFECAEQLGKTETEKRLKYYDLIE